jgi:hypothetical protein
MRSSRGRHRRGVRARGSRPARCGRRGRTNIGTGTHISSVRAVQQGCAGGLGTALWGHQSFRTRHRTRSRWHSWVPPGGLIMCRNPALWWGFQNIDCGLGSGRSWRLDRISGPLHWICDHKAGCIRTGTYAKPPAHPRVTPLPTSVNRAKRTFPLRCCPRPEPTKPRMVAAFTELALAGDLIRPRERTQPATASHNATAPARSL